METFYYESEHSSGQVEAFSDAEGVQQCFKKMNARQADDNMLIVYKEPKMNNLVTVWES